MFAQFYIVFIPFSFDNNLKKFIMDNFYNKYYYNN